MELKITANHTFNNRKNVKDIKKLNQPFDYNQK